MRRVFAIEIYMTCIQTATATVAADNDIVMLSTECEFRYLWVRCVYDRYYSIVRFSNCIFPQSNVQCVCAANISTKCNLTAANTAHNNNRCIEAYTHACQDALPFRLGIRWFVVPCHIAYLLICRLLSSNRSTINFSFAPFFLVPKDWFIHTIYIYMQNHWNIKSVYSSSSRNSYIKLSCFANRMSNMLMLDICEG